MAATKARKQGGTTTAPKRPTVMQAATALRQFGTRLADYQRVYATKGAVGGKTTGRAVSAAKSMVKQITGVMPDDIVALDIVNGVLPKPRNPRATKNGASTNGDFAL